MEPCDLLWDLRENYCDQTPGGPGLNGVCECAAEAWAQFRDEVTALLGEFPAGRWISDEIERAGPWKDPVTGEPATVELTSHAVDRDRVGDLHFDFLVGGRWAYDLPKPGTRRGSTPPPPSTVSLAGVAWDGTALILTSEEHGPRARRRVVRLTRLSSAAARIARHAVDLDDVTTTPGRIASAFLDDVLEVAANLASAAQPGGATTLFTHTGLAEFLAEISDLKHATGPDRWPTVARLSTGWAGSVGELVEAANDVLLPPSQTSLRP